MAATLRNSTLPAQSNTAVTSDLHVIVVGAGFAGLTAAIQCRRKGFKVTLFESFKELKSLGDIISFGPNGGRIFDRWEGIPEKLDPICHRADGLEYYDYKGKHIYTQVWANDREWGKKYNGHRGEIHEILWDYALENGVDIRLGHKVQEYFEDDDCAGVIIDGQKATADVVVAADGVRSTARRIVLGQEDKPKSSGYAIYRAWYSAHDIRKNPSTAWLCENGDKHAIWIGPDIHFIVATVKSGRDVSWVLTHKVCLTMPISSLARDSH
jgi:2-polyprenyl-6-methoxyphenol hydroxylase-like FAD-dependent oxidoreductase